MRPCPCIGLCGAESQALGPASSESSGGAQSGTGHFSASPDVSLFLS